MFVSNDCFPSVKALVKKGLWGHDQYMPVDFFNVDAYIKASVARKLLAFPQWHLFLLIRNTIENTIIISAYAKKGSFEFLYLLMTASNILLSIP